MTTVTYDLRHYPSDIRLLKLPSDVLLPSVNKFMFVKSRDFAQWVITIRTTYYVASIIINVVFYYIVFITMER